MASWKKVIVSGSSAALSGVTVGTNQNITTSPSTTYLSGSFSGSFAGDGTNLTGVTATFPSTAISNLATTDTLFVNDGSNKSITYGNLLTDLAGTNLAVEGADSLTLNANLSGLTSVTATTLTGTTVVSTGIVSGSNFIQTSPGTGFIGTASWAQYVVNGTGGNLTVSGSSNGTPTGGTVINLDTETLAVNGTANQLNTTITNNTVTVGFTNNVVIPNNLTVSNNLTVNGTTTTVSTQNLAVADRFVLFASSSAPTATDGGIIVASSKAGSPATQSGYAFFLDGTGPADPRWGVSSSVSQYATTNVTPDEYAVTAKQASGAPSAAPTYGGSALGYGNIYVNSADESIWIYS